MTLTTRQKRDSPQRHEGTKITATKQPLTPIRHCEERLCGDFPLNEVEVEFEIHERRGNLPSLNNGRENFNDCKTTLQQTQRREIASWMQQRLSVLVLNLLLTETRNDEAWCKRRELRRLHKKIRMTCLGLWPV